MTCVRNSSQIFSTSHVSSDPNRNRAAESGSIQPTGGTPKPNPWNAPKQDPDHRLGDEAIVPYGHHARFCLLRNAVVGAHEPVLQFPVAGGRERRRWHRRRWQRRWWYRRRWCRRRWRCRRRWCRRRWWCRRWWCGRRCRWDWWWWWRRRDVVRGEPEREPVRAAGGTGLRLRLQRRRLLSDPDRRELLQPRHHPRPCVLRLQQLLPEEPSPHQLRLWRHGHHNHH